MPTSATGGISLTSASTTEPSTGSTTHGPTSSSSGGESSTAVDTGPSTDTTGASSTSTGVGTTQTTGTTTGLIPDVGDGTTGDPDKCLAPELYVACDDLELDDWQPNDPESAPFRALGLACPDAGPGEGIVLTSAELHSNNPDAWRVAAAFGVHELAPGERFYGARPAYTLDENNEPTDDVLMPSHSLLMLSTGEISPLDDNYAVVESFDSQAGNGNNGNEDADELPEPMTPAMGSNDGQGGAPFENCDGQGDCSDTLAIQWEMGFSNPNDKIWLDFQTEVPANTHGYRFDFALFSSEWPTYVGTGFNDLFIGWQVSEAYTGNTTFLPDPQNPDVPRPLTITALDAYVQSAGHACLPMNDPNCVPPLELEGTGFERRAATNWVSTRAAVVPGEVVHVILFLADMSDSLLATAVLLDNWRWECTGCTPSPAGDCGVTLE